MEPLDPLLPNSNLPHPNSRTPNASPDVPPDSSDSVTSDSVTSEAANATSDKAPGDDPALRTREDAEEWLVETNTDTFALEFNVDEAGNDNDRQHAKNDADDGLPYDNRDYLTSDRSRARFVLTLPNQPRSTFPNRAPPSAHASVKSRSHHQSWGLRENYRLSRE
ncbi:MAG: hypothetical protein HC795_11440 [Coleofasciculaceae cyanobacterium RL_1_1]|nr:hypothetical protein [Coleofasciculaceae cyanobacterium RL_1_1]